MTPGSIRFTGIAPERTKGQELVALARQSFLQRKSVLRGEYDTDVKEARIELGRARDCRALERLTLKGVNEIHQQVGGRIDAEQEALALEGAIIGAINEHIRVRAHVIKGEREEQHSTIIGAAVSDLEGQVTALLENTHTDSKNVKTELLRELISLVVKTDSLTPDVLAVFGNSRDEAVKALTEKVLVKFKPKAAATTEEA